MKIFIAGDDFFKPDIVIDNFKKVLADHKDKLEFDSIKFPYPIKTRYLADDTVIPTGMAFDDNMDENYGKLGVREYYGKGTELEGLTDDADILVVHGIAVPGYIIKRAEKLKLIGCLRGGPVNIDMDEAKSKGIAVTNTPGKNDQGVAEYVVGLILAHVRNIASSNRYLIQGEYRPYYYNYEVVGMELQNKKIGLVGFGKIGRALTKILHYGFSSQVYTYDPYVDAKTIEDNGAIACEFDELLKTCDVVSLHARGSKNGQPIIGERELSLMKPDALFVNTARGPLVDYPALYDALMQKKIGGATLDVFGLENFKFYRSLINLPNVTATPHIAGSSRESIIRGSVMMAEEIKKFIEGSPLSYKIV